MTAVAYERDARQLAIVRRSELVDLLEAGGRRSAHDLGQILGQATQTTNADLAVLEKEGRVRRVVAADIGWSARWEWEVSDGQA